MHELSVAERYHVAIALASDLLRQLRLIQEVFPSSTNADRMRTVQAVHDELEMAYADRLREGMAR